MIDLRHGKWEDVLAGERCDAIVCDPPYGSRTHDSEVDRNDRQQGVTDGLTPSYAAWTPADVHAFVSSWSPRCKGWMVALTSHDLMPAWEAAYAQADRYCFAPIPCVTRGMSVRIQGDGPSSWTVWAVVARPRTVEFARWGTLRGEYSGTSEPHGRAGGTSRGGGRGKPQWMMQGLVRDYSRPGDLVCDPFAGWGSTLVAAVALGRRAIGAEMDAEAFTEAQRRISRPVQFDMWSGMAAQGEAG